MTRTETHPLQPLLEVLGDSRWVRTHISTLAVGAVLLVCTNLLISSDSLWSLTAIGIWGVLMIVHFLVLIIARLSGQLLEEDEEEIVLLPVKDAVIVNRDAARPTPVTSPVGSPTPSAEPGETVSWQIATDAAQVKRESPKDPTS